MDVADILIDKIFSWVDLQKRCADKLKKLATELEEKKKNFNVSKVVGSSVSVGGAAALTAAGAATLLTGGAAIPILIGVGTAASVLGFSTSVCSEVADIVVSTCTMKEAEEISKKMENLEKGIHKLMNTLKEEGKKREQAGNSFSSEGYVVERILRALAKRNGLKLHDDVSLTKMMSMYKLSGEDIALDILKKSGLSLALLSQFVLRAAAKKAGKSLVTSIGGRAAAKAAGRIAGGAAGLVFSVTELIVNCVNLDNCESETSKSLRDNAKVIRKASKELKRELDEIQKAFQRLAKVKHSTENNKRSLDERETLMEFAMEKCRDETVRQWLRQNSGAFLKLVDMFHFLKKQIDEEEKEFHSNNVDITFVAHGSIADAMIPAKCLLPLSSITDVVLYSPWNCVITARAAYDIATGLMKPRHRKFQCTEDSCTISDEKHRPTELPNHWNSLRKAGDQMIPNIMLSSVKPSGDGAWERFEYLTDVHGPPGRNHIIIPFMPPEKWMPGSESVPFFVVTLALSLVLNFSRFQATIHLTACLGKISSSRKLDRNYLKRQYAYTINNTGMTSSYKRQPEPHKKLMKIVTHLFR